MKMAIVVSNRWQNYSVREILSNELVNGCDIVFYSSINRAGGVRVQSFSGNIVGSVVARDKKHVRLAEPIEESREHSFNKLGRRVTAVSAKFSDRITN